jgi:hypothetical protein
MNIQGIKGSKAKPNRRVRQSEDLSHADRLLDKNPIFGYSQSYVSDRKDSGFLSAYVSNVNHRSIIASTALIATILTGYCIKNVLTEHPTRDISTSAVVQNVYEKEVNSAEKTGPTTSLATSPTTPLHIDNLVFETDSLDSGKDSSFISIFKPDLEELANPAVRQMKHYEDEINKNIKIAEHFVDLYGDDNNPYITKSKLLRLLLTQATQESGLQHFLTNGKLISSVDAAAGFSMFRPIASQQTNRMIRTKSSDPFYRDVEGLDGKLMFEPSEQGRSENIRGMALYLRLLLEKHKGHEGMVELEYVAGQSYFDNYVRAWGNDFNNIVAGLKERAKKQPEYNEPVDYVTRIWEFKKMYDASSNVGEYTTKMLWRRANRIIDHYKTEAHKLEVKASKGENSNPLLNQAVSMYEEMIGFSNMVQEPKGNAKKQLLQHLAVSHYRLAKDHYQLDNYRSAMEHANQSITLDPHKQFYSSQKQHAPMLFLMAKNRYLARK